MSDNVENRLRSRRLIAALLAALAVFAAACGGGETAEPSDSEAASAPAVTSSDDVAAPSDGASDSGEAFLDDAYSQQLKAAAGETVDTAQFKAEPPYDIATIVQGPTNGWGTIFDTVMNHELKESGKLGEQLYVPWDFTTESQANGIADAVSKDVDAILLTSLSRAGLAGPVDQAAAAGIPVITCMAGVESNSYTTEVSRNIPAMGYDSAKQLAEALGGKGKIAMLHGIAGVDAAEFWKSGAQAAFAEYPDISIVAEEYGQWSVADATKAMRAMLSSQDEIDGVWVGGLEMGVSVINAFKEDGRDIPPIAGTNALNGFLRLAKENNVDFYVAPFPPGAAKVCVETVFKVLEGEPVQKFIDVKDVMEGVEPFSHEDVDEHYEPDFNDEFIGPVVVPEDVYAKAGFDK